METVTQFLSSLSAGEIVLAAIFCVLAAAATLTQNVGRLNLCLLMIIILVISCLFSLDTEFSGASRTATIDVVSAFVGWAVTAFICYMRSDRELNAQ